MSKVTDRILTDLWDSAIRYAKAVPMLNKYFSCGDAAKLIDAEIKAARVEALKIGALMVSDFEALAPAFCFHLPASVAKFKELIEADNE